MTAVFNTDLNSLGVNKDLAKERATASFNTIELTHLFDGGPEKTKRRKELGKNFFQVVAVIFIMCPCCYVR